MIDSSLPSHYEAIVLDRDHLSLVQNVKHCAFAYMDQLEGWCSKNKASLLIDLIFILRPYTIVEIGVWGGKSLVPMACALKAVQQGKIYGIDPWDSSASLEGMQGVHHAWWGQVDHKKIQTGLEQKIKEFQLTNQIELKQITSENAEAISFIDLLHIDGNHSEKASTLDVQKWVPLVRKGGFIIFDDTTWGTNITAVKWLNEHCIKLAEYHEDSDWGIWVKS